MKIIIKEREVEYDTDYPNGWKFSAGDPFKVPVMINNYKCFIKRFEKKTVNNISGWPLLNALKGKYETNIPRVYDCREAQEKDQSIHYVFYECIDGKTLEKAIDDDDKIDLTRLTNDLFSGMQSIHRQGFWFTDFCERNIFCEDGGRFLLIDLDSTEPVTELPNNEIDGSKDYWVPVYKYYKDELKKKDMRLDAISGPALNYLQIIYLILHLKEFNEKKEQNYKADEQYDRLSSILAGLSTAASGYFMQALEFKTPTPEFTDGIKNLIHHDILGAPRASIATEKGKPVITQFSANRTRIGAGESLILQWQVDDADKIELYRNGELIQSPGTDQQQTERTEFRDGSYRDVSYHLVASNRAGQTKSESLTISKKKPVKKTGLIWIAALAAAAIFGFLLLQKKINDPFTADNKETGLLDLTISSQRLVEDSLISIAGERLPSLNNVAVLINRVNVPFTRNPGGRVVVKVPAFEFKSGMEVKLDIESDGQTVFSQSLPYFPHIEVYSMDPPNMRDGTSWITIRGKNLHLGKINAYLKNMAWPDSISGDISDAGKNEVTITFNRVAVHAFLPQPAPAGPYQDNNGFIQAYFQEAARPLHQINETLQGSADRTYKQLINRFRTGPTYTVVSHLSLCVVIEDQPKLYQLFDSFKVHQGTTLSGLLLLDTVVLKTDAFERVDQ